VKFKCGDKILFKSNTIFKNLNPVWEESFAQLIDDPTVPIVVEVFDYDRFAADDFMGSATIDISQFTYWKPFEQKLLLSDDNCAESYMGYVNVQVTIEPQTDVDKQKVRF
jgi:Ca2+-dependent lipid-binding protein